MINTMKEILNIRYIEEWKDEGMNAPNMFVPKLSKLPYISYILGYSKAA